MNEEPTTGVIQRCLDALQQGTAAEPLVRDLLERAVGRLRLLCAALLRRSYPRLMQPPLNLETDELLDGVVAGLLTALHQNGYTVVDHEPDYVIVGEGRTFNLELVERAVDIRLELRSILAQLAEPRRALECLPASALIGSGVSARTSEMNKCTS